MVLQDPPHQQAWSSSCVSLRVCEVDIVYLQPVFFGGILFIYFACFLCYERKNTNSYELSVALFINKQLIFSHHFSPAISSE